MCIFETHRKWNNVENYLHYLVQANGGNWACRSRATTWAADLILIKSPTSGPYFDKNFVKVETLKGILFWNKFWKRCAKANARGPAVHFGGGLPDLPGATRQVAPFAGACLPPHATPPGDSSSQVYNIYPYGPPPKNLPTYPQAHTK